MTTSFVIEHIWQILTAQNVAIKTNTLYWLTTTPTLGTEMRNISQEIIELLSFL
ncbi:DUF3575 domain-containing protein [Bacteroides congonensis]|uniref:DUF3575 domain-containing protein n=1 Tax=Bacteroides congonensis TaxID=1871006 RepID=UPI003A84F011